MVLTRITCLFLHSWTLQAKWSIYYFHRLNHGANLSLHSYHPTDPNGSKEIASFEYPQDINYQVAPIWDCKVALVPENSTMQEVVTYNMLTKAVKSEHTLLNKRIGFATMLLNKSQLYVCGGLFTKEHVCEVWIEKGHKFVDTGHNWKRVARSSFTMDEIGGWLCFFGGFFLLLQERSTYKTQTVECFNDQGTSTVIKTMENCFNDKLQFRAKHASIRYDNETVILCGGQGVSATDKCDVVQISIPADLCNDIRGTIIGTCLNPIEIKKLNKYTSPRLLRWGESILLFGGLANKSNSVERQARVVKLLAGYLSRGQDQLPLSHNDYSNIRLFNVPDSCTPPEHIMAPVQGIVTTPKANIPAWSSESVEPYKIALGCISGLSLLLLFGLVFVIAKCTSRPKFGLKNETTINMPKQETESSVMSKQNTDVESSNMLTSAWSQTPLASENDHLVGINLKSKLGQAEITAQLTTFPHISESSATCNTVIGSSDVCSHTNTRTPIASSCQSTA